MTDLQQDNQRGQWGSKFGFIMAAAGSAVGLGNIWKFPYITGENGGGLFVLIYLFCIAIVGIPIMMAEIMIGRAAQKQSVVAFEKLQGKKTAWTAVGWIGMIAGFVILSYYIVVAGWAMDFTLKSVTNFTAPIHDAAELAARQYRATATQEEMTRMLVGREAERKWRDPLALARREIRPSVWNEYALYQAGLDAAGAVNIAERHAIIKAWAGLEDVFQEITGTLLPEDLNDQQLAKLQSVDAKIRDDSELWARLQAAEDQFLRFEEIKRDHLIAADEKYSAISPKEIRDAAENATRRGVIFDSVQTAFLDVASDGWTSTFWAGLFMLITVLIVASGVGSGIEKTCRILMPTLFGLILVMVVFGASQSGFGEAMSFVFKPDPSKLKPSGVLEALGHAFFTLSLGMGAMITYGSYQKSKDSIASQSIIIAGLDTGIALLACMMMFPIIFSYGQDPSAGPGLVFMSMPLAFAEIGTGGILLSILFFGLVVFAALTSAISLLEVVASYFIDKHRWSRRRAAWTFGGVIFLFSLPSAFAMDPDFIMVGWEKSFGLNFFDTMDYLASNWLLPLGGLFIAIYAGWVMPKRLLKAEIKGMNATLAMGWLLALKTIVPILVIIVLAQKVGLLDADEFFFGLF